MLCDGYKSLDRMEEADFISRLLHCVKSKDQFFHVARSIIQEGELIGLFDAVKFRPNIVGQPDPNEVKKNT